MPRALKVYRTPIGFHDAYVAAPTQKAALAAWGSGHDLFARGQVEIVTDPALTDAPLATPGTVVKRLRGTAAEQVAALPRSPKPKPKPNRAAETAAKPAARPRVPRPDRAALEKAEAALAELEARAASALAALAKEEAALTAKRRRLEAEQRHDRDRVEAEVLAARKAYETAIAGWAG
jgi:hypothetical protein